MHDRHVKNSIYALYPNAVYLSDRYRQLEGFTSIPDSDTKVLTTADVRLQRPAPPAASLAEAAVTLFIMFGLLVGSSVILGLVANQAVAITQHLTRTDIQQVESRF